MKEVSTFILRLYFAVVSAVTIFTLMFAAVDLLNIALKNWVFTAADVPIYIEDCASYFRIDYNPNDSSSKPISAPTSEDYQKESESRNASALENYEREKAIGSVQNLALILIALPLFLLHFRIVLRDWKTLKDQK